MIIAIFLLVLGFVILIKGADWFVDGASALAKNYNVSDLAIGLTIVAFGTSAPELVVTVFASVQGHQDVLFGNIIGSNNFNLFVILGVTGLISSLMVQSSTVWKEIPFSFIAALLLFLLASDVLSGGDGMLSRVDGLVFLAFFGFFLYYVYKQLRSDSSGDVIPEKDYSPFKILSFIVIGLGALILGGRLVVNNAGEIATGFGVSETVIGLTIVAAGTSLPELVTSVVAALRKNADIAVGNIIGSNIFNIFFILGVGAVIHPVEFNMVFNKDIYFLLAGTIILFIAMFTGKKKKLDRWEAGVLLVLYVGYTAWMIGS